MDSFQNKNEDNNLQANFKICQIPELAQEKEKSKIILFGDSLTQKGFQLETEGWAIKVANNYIRKQDVVNRGFSGYTTENTLPILEKMLKYEFASSEISLISIFLGANDAILPLDEQKPRPNLPSKRSQKLVPLVDYKNNLISMINFIQKHSEIKILLITPPPLMENRFYGYNRKNSHTIKYREAMKKVSIMKNCSLLDTWNLFKEKNFSAIFIEDGLHFDKLGNNLIAEGFMKTIEVDFPHLLPRSLNNLYE
ncbi:isoamyl acetate-hydrolyzing esterase [Clydaea vesicula]|uniref:Isoamyl acetate-hydrolyzing esterase n=1 Tax=Clydaea vesicula TaxID=447962 RepID=A0AAD5XU71_9FUNG|nr:isoamyl acetate-hydrolyzing esterase [Clydaea vesicula]